MSQSVIGPHSKVGLEGYEKLHSAGLLLSWNQKPSPNERRPAKPLATIVSISNSSESVDWNRKNKQVTLAL